MFFKKIIFQNTYVELGTPPPSWKIHLKFPFWLFDYLPKTEPRAQHFLGPSCSQRIVTKLYYAQWRPLWELPLIVHLAPPLLIPAFIEGQSQRGVNISVATRVPTRCYPAQHSVCVTSIDINTSTHRHFQRVVMSCHTASSDNVITTSRSQC